MTYTIVELSDKSSIICGEIPIKVQPVFNELWSKKPATYSTVKIFGRDIPEPRWSANFLRAYDYAGVKHDIVTSPLPDELSLLFDWTNKEFGRDKGIFNQVLVNFYADGTHYIGRHSDDERQLKQGTSIFSASFGQERLFRIREKKTRKVVQEINMKNGTFILMCGNMQKEFTHEVPKVGGMKGKNLERRINVTFRIFK